MITSAISYRDHDLHLLDLTRDPATRTSAVFASLAMIARAVEHIRRTGERIMILAATSGNKGTALREAALRALEAGLVHACDLSVVVLAPTRALPKLRSTALATDPHLLRRNPVLLYAGTRQDDVRNLAAEFAKVSEDLFMKRWNLRLWCTLDLTNYVAVDAARAFFEAETLPPAPDRPRVHAHTVSNSHGLLGYHLGRRVLHGPVDPDHPRSLLVQHLRTPDLVLGLRRGSARPATPPTYTYRPADGRYTQHADPEFPYVTDDPAEELDSTFHTREPVTAPMVKAVVGRHGGGGIVVSRHECLRRYDELRWRLAAADIHLPADSGRLRDWSLVMALTGVMNAVDRNLLDDVPEVVVHASGCYSTEDREALPRTAVTLVRSVAAMSDPIESSVQE
jgi:hypothetical protein